MPEREDGNCGRADGRWHDSWVKADWVHTYERPENLWTFEAFGGAVEGENADSAELCPRGRCVLGKYLGTEPPVGDSCVFRQHRGGEGEHR